MGIPSELGELAFEDKLAAGLEENGGGNPAVKRMSETLIT
jgi:hypothetical protein